MTIQLFLWAFVIAFAFVAWPILSSKSGIPGAWVGVLVLLGSLVGNALVGFKSIWASPMFTLKGALIVLVAGFLNGVAVYFYGVKAADSSVPTGLFVTSSVVFMAILAPFIDLVVKGTSFSLPQQFGIIVVGVGLWLVKG